MSTRTASAFAPAVILFCLFAAPAAAQDPTVQDAMGLIGEKKYDEAAVVLEQILEKDPDNGRAMIQLGLVHAARGELDDAFAWLEKAKTRTDITSIALNPVSENLREDPRYQKLFPTPADYEDSFVEEAVI